MKVAGPLAAPLDLLEARLSATYPETAFLWFRRVFCLKVAVYGVLTGLAGNPKELLSCAALVAGLVLCFRRDHYRIGVAILLAARLVSMSETFPYTLNHNFLECWVLLILVTFPAERAKQADGIQGWPARMVQVAVLSVWFYAGLQKIVHGQYLNGALLGQYGLFEGGALLPLMSVLQTATGAGELSLPLAHPGLGVAAPLAVPQGARAILLAASWLTVLGEIGLPLLSLVPRWRTAAVASLIVLQLAFGLPLTEISFTLTSCACLLLFFPRWAGWSYPALVLALALAIPFEWGRLT